MHKYKLTIVKGSNFFKIQKFDNDIKALAFQFTRRFIRMNYNNQVIPDSTTPEMTVFAAALKDRSEFRFHINSFNDWMRLLKQSNVQDSLIKLIELPDFEVQRVSLPMRAGWVPYDYQKPVIEYLVADNNPKTDNKFVGIKTGKGKGMCAISALSRIGERTMIIVRPGYIEKWVTELHEKLDIPIESIMVIQGTKHLQTFLDMCVEGGLENNRIAILSNRTYQNWLKAYEEFGEDIDQLGYPFTPDELFERYKAGIRLIDEVHLDFHLCFKADLYTHTRKCISLSATLDSRDPKTKELYQLAYPARSRGPEMVFDKYVDTYSVTYYLDSDRVFKTQEYNQSNYSHIAYEKSILRSQPFFLSYANMIKTILDHSYIKKKKEGQKAIVFASSIAMCTKLTEYLRKAYPQFDVRRFCEDDSEENLHDADIRVSNVIKAGTGHDIKGLITVVLTIAIDSMQSNLQIFGRLREIKGADTDFYFLTCQDIPKHKNYHRNKLELLKPESKSFTEMMYPKRV